MTFEKDRLEAGMMDLVKAIIAGIVSSASVIAVAAFIGRESFKRVLDKRPERF